MDDLLSEFLTETAESLAVLDVELVNLERNPNDPELLSNIFRIVHTIKGTCGFLGLPRLESIAHAAENVLGKVRDGELQVTGVSVTLILASLDKIKDILATLEETEAEPEGNDAQLIADLDRVAKGEELPSGKAAADTPVAPAKEKSVETEVAITPSQEAIVSTPAAVKEVASHDVAPVKQAAQTPVQKKVEPAAEPHPVKESNVAAQTIRVHVDLLENLMTMVSELVLTRNQLLQILRQQKDSEFAAPLQRLNHVTSELQEGVMKTRMQPIGNAWAKLPRMVRDLALELNKKIDLQMYGAETELDRQVLDLIKDPLTHMVRNSADHGLEMPDERVAVGKSETGRVTLNAYHEGGHIIIEIGDDGRGLNIEKIKSKIIANGMATEADLDTLTDQQIQQYIFRAGFSTATKVTAVSGRGVGMDVVRTNIEKIGGTIELKSQEGKGSTFVIKIPLTLAIVNALIVECALERFAIPQISVDELVRAGTNSEHKIERIKDTPVLRLRNRLLPLVSLKNILKLDAIEEEVENDSEVFIVVTQVGTYIFGIIVDRVFDTEEIVVKPVAPILRDIPLFSGNTILGDGSVIMILDPNGLAAASGEMAVSESGMAEHKRKQDVLADDQSAMLVFEAGSKTPKAVPLALVARLEEIDLEKVEYSNGKPVVQYRDKLMPLVAIDNNCDLNNEGRQPILVFADGEHSMGLIVDEIVDIVEDRINVQLASDRPGLIGSAIIAGQATDVIDAGFYLTEAFRDWFDRGELSSKQQKSGSGHRILLVDDSAFFRNLIAPILEVAGYSVVSVESAEDALQLADDGDMYDAIVSDIDMPGMDGFEFAKVVRSSPRWAHLPMVALSSYASEQDFDRGRMVGYSDYVSKADRDALLQALAELLVDEQGVA